MAIVCEISIDLCFRPLAALAQSASIACAKLAGLFSVQVCLTAYPPLHKPTPPSMRYPIPTQETTKTLVTPLVWRVSMGGRDHLL
ncbi:hypothetical protein EVAR_40683_1 [Eumeta japonica]|uniref:Uncharacterized protein n=1 Tax=Eumeta variegata TaxID=151549 RepID=A0A4C1X687_EUMVA|nr:hypothetical protein EVAR_40683_1 [Eumeta japonica]